MSSAQLPVHYYVYYKCDPRRMDELRPAVERLFQSVRAATGIAGQWQQRRDDATTFMEVYLDVPQTETFEPALEAAVAGSGFANLGVQRVTEVFRCA
ncbi:MAG: DUF4936 family protein [Betaproteobacteria bacterium]